MVVNISCKFEKASYNIFFVRAVTVKSLYTLQPRRNEAKDAIRWIQQNTLIAIDLKFQLIYSTAIL